MPISSYTDFLASVFWANIREEKLRLNPVCELCGNPKSRNVHHKFYRPNPYDVQVGDLQTLCKKCHRSEHGFGKPPDLEQRAKEAQRKIHRIIKRIPRHRRKRVPRLGQSDLQRIEAEIAAMRDAGAGQSSKSTHMNTPTQ